MMYDKTVLYGVLLESFLGVMTTTDPELHHKSYIKKIQNKVDRYHKRRQAQCAVAEHQVREAVASVEKDMKGSGVEISIRALLWLIQNRHKKELQPYCFNAEAFEQLNRSYNAQGAILTTAKVLTKIEEALDGSADRK